MQEINWKYTAFKNLSLEELYQILRLRAEVFVVEQNCPYNDLDGKDLSCEHLLGFDGNELVAYSRIVPIGVAYKTESSIGRIITSQKKRGTGLGKILVDRSVKVLQESYGKVPIRIGAQCYAIKFYEACNFKLAGEEYDEDGIPHIEMLYQYKKRSL